MKLSRFDIDKKLSITQMKQVKAGSVSTSSGSNFAVTNVRFFNAVFNTIGHG